MRALVSGEEVKRYEEPTTETFILFPYLAESGDVRLYSVEEMNRLFPAAWAYLKRHEKQLRARERDAFNDDAWYRFGRNQNIGKQRRQKLLVPRLTKSLCVAVDATGSFCLDNVDVNGVLADDDETVWFLAGVLNNPVSNLVGSGSMATAA